MKLLGISGSLRNGSFNTALLQAAAKCLPEGVSLHITGLADLPLYNADIDGDKKPAAVRSLQQSIRESDGMLIATPEYNYSIPGVLKNGLDWASRPAYKSVLAGKPVAILSVSGSPVGGARAQVHLRDVLSSTLCSVVPAPHFLVPMAKEKFDEELELTDAETEAKLRRYLEDFALWIGRLVA